MLSDYGEDQLVAALLSQLPPFARRSGVYAGAGEDDCALVEPLKRKHRLLLKTDCVIEGIHFLPDTPPEQIGWKALCRPLSDIASTGGKPLHALVTFAVNRQRTLAWATNVYAGIGKAAREFGVTVVGGETASSPGPCFISVCLTGSVRRGRCVTRGGGKPGDLLYVTGRLGGSFPSGKHLHFRPRLAEGRWLARRDSVHAMMDLSDGLGTDLPRLARASGTGYCLDSAAVPRTPGCTVAQACGDGEDYELLVAVASGRARELESAWKRRFPNVPFTVVGSLAETDVKAGLGDTPGFDHFSDR